MFDGHRSFRTDDESSAFADAMRKRMIVNMTGEKIITQ